MSFWVGANLMRGDFGSRDLPDKGPYELFGGSGRGVGGVFEGVRL